MKLISTSLKLCNSYQLCDGRSNWLGLLIYCTFGSIHFLFITSPILSSSFDYSCISSHVPYLLSSTLCVLHVYKAREYTSNLYYVFLNFPRNAQYLSLTTVIWVWTNIFFQWKKKTSKTHTQTIWVNSINKSFYYSAFHK